MRTFIAAVMTFLFVWSPAPSSANADDAAQLRDRSARITLAARQSALLHSMTMSMCFSIGGLDSGQMVNQALEQADTYGTVLAGLRYGQQWLELTPETNPAHLAAIAQSEGQWTRFEPAIRQLVAGDWHTVVIRQSLAFVLPTQDAADVLARHYLTSFGDALMDAPTAAAMTRAAYYRMLSQRALSEMCFIHFGLGLAPDRLGLTLGEMDTVAQTLTDGADGIAAPPNGRVARNLRTAFLFWSKMRPVLDRVAAGDSSTATEMQKVLKFNRSVLKQLDQAVAGYVPTP